MIKTTKFAGFLLFIGILQFILLMKSSEFIYPNYSVAKNFISDLELRLEELKE